MPWFIFIVSLKFKSEFMQCVNGVCDKFVTVALLEGYKIDSAQAKTYLLVKVTSGHRFRG